ncbi:helix-turn-helix transcriptional regulator [Williamsia sterculiae]|uniref:Regulatory protein, luxR family n=1 Tax=Williamsia sterculiae TaxID=1344003 RepID=A0A1N7CG78_9NOCA|nr:helix-turn-helix transcriptional regulator [Williamsia sterculiae]SIR62575.1 regulatory protein, luxR family [Williamsia sterculiae]
MNPRWADSVAVLDAVTRIAAATRADLLEVLSAEIGDLIPHRAAILRTEDCARDPVKTVGDARAVAAVDLGMLRDLAQGTEPGAPARLVTFDIDGSPRRLVVVSAVSAAGRGATLVLVDSVVDGPADDVTVVLGHLWAAVAAIAAERAVDTGPDLLVGNLAASTARRRAAADLGREHRVTLHGILAVLRSRRLPDDRARQVATDLGVAAVVASQTAARDRHELGHQPVGDAVEALAAEFAPVAGHRSLEIVGPEDPRTDIPLDVAATARTVSRGLLLVALERRGVSRLRCAWTLANGSLQVEVRDDADGEVADGDGAPPVTFDADLPDRVEAVGGHLRSDTTAGWGTTATAVFPLHTADPVDPGPIHALHPREREVLVGLRDGLRNRDIARQLGLSEHTVKFHVRNILDKLDVRTRGEAAAMAHDHLG